MASKYTVEQQIQRSKDIYGEDTYDYSLFTEYKSNKIPYPIKCKKHDHIFHVKMNDHLGQKRSSCVFCAIEEKSTNKELTTFSKIQQTLDSKFGVGIYNLVDQYLKHYPSDSQLQIICKTHGEFNIRTRLVVQEDCYGGCPQCKKNLKINSELKKKETAKQLQEDNRKKNYEQFIKRASSKFNNFFDYSNVNYINTSTPVEIICPKHGSIFITPEKHLAYRTGCSKCGKEVVKPSKTTEEFIKEAQSIHKNSDGTPKYDYSKTKYAKIRNKLTIICPYHGGFAQQANGHLQGFGCPTCAVEHRGDLRRKPLEQFILEASKIHNNFYDYSLVDYKNTHTKVKIICPTHGEFKQGAKAHVFGAGCPACVGIVSKPELEILDYINSLVSTTVQQSYRRIGNIKSREVDIYLPKFNLAIEYNGSTYHHSSKSIYVKEYESKMAKPSTYHFDKWKMCFDNDITLLSIYDFYWADENKKEIIKSKIRHYLWLDKKIYARKTYIKELDNATAYKFYDSNHLEGKGMAYKSAKSYGLYSKEDDTLLMCATVGEIYNQSSKSFKTKLHRICTLLDYTVIGGISKLAKHIKSDIGKSFTYQITLSSGGTSLKSVNSYKILPPRYFWVGKNGKGFIYHHRNYCQKQVLEKHFGVPLLKQDTENTYMERLGYLKVYDNGLAEIEM